MDLPLIGTVDLTPSGLFLIFAMLVAGGYIAWQVVGSRQAASRSKSPELAQGDGAHDDSAVEK